MCSFASSSQRVNQNEKPKITKTTTQTERSGVKIIAVIANVQQNSNNKNMFQFIVVPVLNYMRRIATS